MSPARPPLDPRLNAYRHDLADLRLAGQVEATRFVMGETMRVRAAAAPLRRLPAAEAPLDSEALRGEAVRVFETAAGWAWCQLDDDGYVGWLPTDTLGPADVEPTHWVTAPRTFLFPAPDLKRPPRAALSLGSRLALGEEVETRGVRYRLLEGGEGAVAARHVARIGAAAEADFVAVAERFLHVPYLWGGRTSLGLDCSGLVQLALMAAGIAAPRDSDLQERALGEPVGAADGGGLARGDLIFWPGHVGIMTDERTLLHANAHHMAVALEPLAAARARIERTTPVSSIRRFPRAAGQGGL